MGDVLLLESEIKSDVMGVFQTDGCCLKGPCTGYASILGVLSAHVSAVCWVYPGMVFEGVSGSSSGLQRLCRASRFLQDLSEIIKDFFVFRKLHGVNGIKDAR